MDDCVGVLSISMHSLGADWAIVPSNEACPCRLHRYGELYQKWKTRKKCAFKIFSELSDFHAVDGLLSVLLYQNFLHQTKTRILLQRDKWWVMMIAFLLLNNSSWLVSFQAVSSTDFIKPKSEGKGKGSTNLHFNIEIQIISLDTNLSLTAGAFDSKIDSRSKILK